MGRPCQSCDPRASAIVSQGAIEALSAPLIQQRLAEAGLAVRTNGISRHIALHLGEPRGRGGRRLVRKRRLNQRPNHEPARASAEAHERRKAEWSGWGKRNPQDDYVQDDRLARQRHLRRFYGIELSIGTRSTRNREAAAQSAADPSMADESTWTTRYETGRSSYAGFSVPAAIRASGCSATATTRRWREP